MWVDVTDRRLRILPIEVFAFCRQAYRLVTTLGSQFWPVTTEGKILCLLLSVYSVSVLGYIAATLASYFIDRDATQVVRPRDVRKLQQSVEHLSTQIQSMSGAGPSAQERREYDGGDKEGI